MTLEDLLRRHEGDKEFPYYDSKGILTIGVGHNLIARGLPQDIRDELLKRDVADTVNQLRDRDWYVALEEAGDVTLLRRYAVIDMALMGVEKIDGFIHMIAALRLGDWETAAKEILNSKWASDVKEGRASEVAHMMRTNEMPV